MKISMNLADLRGLASDCAGIVPRQATNPALACVLLVADGDTLTATATDTTATIRDSVPASVSEPGSVLVDAKTLVSVAKGLTGDSVAISVSRGRLLVSASGASFRLPLVDVDDYPPVKIEDSDGATVSGAAMSAAFEAINHAISQDDNRYGLNGAHVEQTPTGVRVVATDGARLCYSEIATEGEINPPKSRLLPRRAVADMRRLASTAAGAWVWAMSDGLATFRTGALSYSVRLIDGEFPDYRQVIPDRFDRVIQVAPDALKGSLRRAGIVADGQTNSARLGASSDGLTISAESPDAGGVTETIPASVEGPDILTGISARYMGDAIGAVGGDLVVISMGGELAPIQITSPENPDTVAIVMPMRLD